MRISRKKINLVIGGTLGLSVLTIMFLILGNLILRKLNESPSSPTDTIVISQPVQSDLLLSYSNHNVEFSTKIGSIDSNNPYSGELNFNSNISVSNLNITELKPSLYLIQSSAFLIVVSSGGEGNPIGLLDGVLDEVQIDNSLGIELSRVGGSGYSRNRFPGLANYTHIFFYSNDFRINKECGDFTNVSCGLEYLRYIHNNTPIPIYLFCGVNAISDIKYCDEFISNLIIH